MTSLSADSQSYKHCNNQGQNLSLTYNVPLKFHATFKGSERPQCNSKVSAAFHCVFRKVNPTVILPVLVLSRLQHRPHKLICSTGVQHKERLTEQGMLLTHRHRGGQGSFTDEDGDNTADGAIVPAFTCRVIVLRGLS